MVRHPAGGPRAAHRQCAVYTGVKGIPRGHGHWQLEQQQDPHGGPQQGLAGPPEVPAGVRDRVLRLAPVDPRRPRLARATSPLEARAGRSPTRAALRHDVRAPRRSRCFSGHWQGGGEPCVPFKCGDRTGNAGSVISLRLALGDFHDSRPDPSTGEPSTSTSARSAEYPTEPIGLPRPARRAGPTSCSRAS